MNRVTKGNKIRNKCIRCSIEEDSIKDKDKIRENILKYLGHVFRREKTESVRIVSEIYVTERWGKEN